MSKVNNLQAAEGYKCTYSSKKG